MKNCVDDYVPLARRWLKRRNPLNQKLTEWRGLLGSLDAPEEVRTTTDPAVIGYFICLAAKTISGPRFADWCAENVRGWRG